MSGAGAPGDSTHCDSLFTASTYFSDVYSHMQLRENRTYDGVGRLGQYRFVVSYWFFILLYCFVVFDIII